MFLNCPALWHPCAHLLKYLFHGWVSVNEPRCHSRHGGGGVKGSKSTSSVLYVLRVPTGSWDLSVGIKKDGACVMLPLSLPLTAWLPCLLLLRRSTLLRPDFPGKCTCDKWLKNFCDRSHQSDLCPCFLRFFLSSASLEEWAGGWPKNVDSAPWCLCVFPTSLRLR